MSDDKAGLFSDGEAYERVMGRCPAPIVGITGSSGFTYPSWLLRTDAVPSANTLATGWLQSLTTAGTDAASLEAYTAVGGSGKQFYDAQSQFNTLIKARTPAVPYPGDSTYPVKNLNGGNLTSALSNELKLIAQMIASDLPTQVYYARLGGWDTHSNQANDHPNLQRALGGSIKAFWDDLATITTAAGPAQDRVLIATWSEFGRRVQENNGGTDHGTASLSFVVGKKLKGGLYGSGRIVVVRGMLGPSQVHARSIATARYILGRAGTAARHAVRPTGSHWAAFALPVEVERGSLTAVFAPDLLDRAGQPIRLHAPPGGYVDLWSGEAVISSSVGELVLHAADGIALLWQS